MVHSNAMVFWILFVLLFFVNMIIPNFLLVMQTYDSSITENTEHTFDSDSVTEPTALDFVTLNVLNFMSVFFWTWGFVWWINIFVMLPIRILAVIMLIDLVLP